MFDSLGDRMKTYEAVTKNSLVRRMPAIIRLDGRAFHTLTRGMEKPFDETFFKIMATTCEELFPRIQTASFLYYQSDEISILLKDYATIETDAWFAGQVQKIVSISAAICTALFNEAYINAYGKKPPTLAVFDSRVFNIPKEDVVNYFIWRQKDATRNSINGTAQCHFSQNQLNKKSQIEVLDMLQEGGINWNKTPTRYKRGISIYREPFYTGVEVVPILVRDEEIPIFTENRDFISRFL